MSRHHVKLSGPRWERARRAALDAVNWRCSECGHYGNEVHHIKPLSAGGLPYALGNLRVYCKAHHIAHHKPPLSPEQAAWRDLVNELQKQ